MSSPSRPTPRSRPRARRRLRGALAASFVALLAFPPQAQAFNTVDPDLPPTAKDIADQPPRGYSPLQVTFHWVVAALVVYPLLFHEGRREPWDALKHRPPSSETKRTPGEPTTLGR